MGINLGDYKRVINLFVCIVVDTEARKLAHWNPRNPTRPKGPNSTFLVGFFEYTNERLLTKVQV
jgi:hypothetical protein